MHLVAMGAEREEGTAVRPRLSVDAYAAGILARDRALLAQAITLVDSRNANDAALAQELITRLLPRTGTTRASGSRACPASARARSSTTSGYSCSGKEKRSALRFLSNVGRTTSSFSTEVWLLPLRGREGAAPRRHALSLF